MSWHRGCKSSFGFAHAPCSPQDPAWTVILIAELKLWQEVSGTRYRKQKAEVLLENEALQYLRNAPRPKAYGGLHS